MSLLGGLAGGLVSTLYSAQMGSKVAKDNRAFQRDMSSTAHQREVQDLAKAGLNPILSATGGAGASTPSGATAPIPDVGSTLSKGVSSALQYKALKNTIKETESRIDVNKAEEKQKKANTKLLDANVPKAVAESKLYTGSKGKYVAGTKELLQTLGSVANMFK